MGVWALIGEACYWLAAVGLGVNLAYSMIRGIQISEFVWWMAIFLMLLGAGLKEYDRRIRRRNESASCPAQRPGIDIGQ